MALADSTALELRSRPTANLDAYDQFLKGEAAAVSGDRGDMRRAMQFYERAVALDPAFALAWARLSQIRAAMVWNGAVVDELSVGARTAAERARALRPDAPETALALGWAWKATEPIDLERSLAEYRRGLSIAPDNVDLLAAVAIAELGFGQVDSALPRLARAAALDPRSAAAARRLSAAYLRLRRYAAAESAAVRAVALEPQSMGNVYGVVIARLARGNLAGARSALREAEAHIDPDALTAGFALGEDLYWVLDDEQQRRVLALPLSTSAFDGDRAIWAALRMHLHHHRGDSALAVAWADSTRLALEAQLREHPSDAQRHAILSTALAHLGRKEAAIREGKLATELMPMSRGYPGYYMQHQLVRTYILVNEPELALDALEPLLKTDHYVTPGWLRIDPMFDPLREHPRFRELVR
jgi:tetratricopeptide (TPR) repeat protein